MPSYASRTLTRRHLLGALGAVSAASLAACTSGKSPETRAIDVRRFGAKGDGRTDDQRALERALRAVEPGQALSFGTGGVFRHSDVLTLRVPDVLLLGGGTLEATDEQNSAVTIDAANVRVRDLTFAVSATTQRWSAAEQHKLYLGPHAGIELDDVSISGSAAAGLYAYGPTGFRFRRLTVRDTRADGIHLTNGARHGMVERPRCSRTGDDGVAVVSYLQDPTPCSDITVDRPIVRTTTGGRGISVVGGHDVDYRDVTISASSAAAIYLACEGGDFVTHPTKRVTVRGGRIDGANTDAAIDHGAVLVYSGRAGGSVEEVTVSDLTIAGTRPGASRQIGAVADGPDDALAAIVFDRLRLAGTPDPYQGNAPAGPVTLADVTAAGSRVRLTT